MLKNAQEKVIQFISTQGTQSASIVILNTIVLQKKKTIDGNGSVFLILSRSFGEWKLKYEYLQ